MQRRQSSFPLDAGGNRMQSKNERHPSMRRQTAEGYWAFEGELKWAIQVSNQGHPACKAGALPLS